MILAALPSTLTGRFAFIIEGLCRVITARCAAAQGAGNVARVVIFFLVWDRLRRIAARFTTLAARARAGTLRPRLPSLPADPDRADAGWDKDLRYKPERLPNRFGWLLELVPEADHYRGLLQDLLQDPEFAELLTAAPQMERLLSPLFRMLGIQDPKSPDAIPPIDTSPFPATLSEPELSLIAQCAVAPPAQASATHPPPGQVLAGHREHDGLRRSRRKA